MRKRKSWLVVLVLLGYFFFRESINVQAADEPYTIDQAPLTPPNFSGYEVVKVSTSSELSNLLSSKSTTKVIYELQNNLTITGQILINGDKAIHLNGYTLNAASSGYLLIGNGSSTKQLKLYNGTITGGPTSTAPSGYTAATPNAAFLNAHNSQQTEVIIENINYKSSDTGGNFFDGIAASVFSLGTVEINTFAQNIRAGNMTFLGDFTGYSFGSGSQSDEGNGRGGVNLSFAGYSNSYINSFNRGNKTMSQTMGDRRMYIGKDSHVVLKNESTSSLNYANNIGNFSVLNIDGSLEATAIGTSLRTTASNSNNGQPYNNRAGTYNGQANITINEGGNSKFFLLIRVVDTVLYIHIIQMCMLLNRQCLICATLGWVISFMLIVLNREAI